MNAHHVPIVQINQTFWPGYNPAESNPEQPAAQLALDLGPAFSPSFRTDVPIFDEERVALDRFRKLSGMHKASNRDLKQKRAKEKRDFSQIALSIVEQATGTKPLKRQ